MLIVTLLEQKRKLIQSLVAQEYHIAVVLNQGKIQEILGDYENR
jgi:hypothetical protein